VQGRVRQGTEGRVKGTGIRDGARGGLGSQRGLGNHSRGGPSSRVLRKGGTSRCCTHCAASWDPPPPPSSPELMQHPSHSCRYPIDHDHPAHAGRRFFFLEAMRQWRIVSAAGHARAWFYVARPPMVIGWPHTPPWRLLAAQWGCGPWSRNPPHPPAKLLHA
jgi:hypothetical protein